METGCLSGFKDLGLKSLCTAPHLHFWLAKEAALQYYCSISSKQIVYNVLCLLCWSLGHTKVPIYMTYKIKIITRLLQFPLSGFFKLK